MTNLAQQPAVTLEPNAPSPDNRELAATREKTKPAARQTPVPNLREPEVASFVLASAVLRGAEAAAPELVLPARAKTLRMELELPSDSFKPPRAVLQNAPANGAEAAYPFTAKKSQAVK